MNEFVSYLHSINNMGGSSTGSLAEAQVKSPYFDKVKVDRRLGSYIVESVRSGQYRTFILTGHAGDGKTSILVQVLKELSLIQPGEGLSVEREYDGFLYFKDMSEIPEGQQVTALKRALEAPSHQKSCLLISNTGPLLAAFLALAEEKRAIDGKQLTSDERIALLSRILHQLDKNEDHEIDVEGYNPFLVNIARVDNIYFSKSIVQKIINPELWEDCNSCQCAGRCPIKANRDQLAKQFDRICAFIENYYRYLYENDKRLTIRQIIGQISYALTGNLSCSSILKKHYKEPFFNYNFANLFFGYCGIDPIRSARQIKGIEQLQLLALDRIALDIDYQLFVKHDFSCFLPEIARELEELNKKYYKHYRISEEDLESANTAQHISIKTRQAIRRFYLMYSLSTEEQSIDGILNQIFGDSYTNYIKLIREKQPKQVLRQLQTTVYQALYMKNVGVLPGGDEDLPLTLRREGDVFQNVLLVLGKVSKSKLEVRQRPVQSKLEDVTGKQSVYLKLNDKEFPLTLPMVNYFSNLIAGAIASNNNPALTHGIATLDTILLEEFGEPAPDNIDDCELQVIINTTSGQETERFAFEDKQLTII